jgi:Lrp/AsnC family transcriptional regulator, regulator for asnA, asnC and gidA
MKTKLSDKQSLNNEAIQMELKTKRDIVLMTFFRNNSRENLTQISRLTHIPVSTIFDKLKNFEKELIHKHTVLVDFKKLGFDIQINILFKIAKESREDFKKFLMGSEHVNSVFRVNNGFDYMVEAIFKDMSDLHNFTEQLDRFKIEAKQELFILEDLKRESFLSEEIHRQLLI